MKTKKASKRRRTRRPNKSKLSHLPTQTHKRRKLVEEGVSRVVEKYWFQRYDLFSRYDEGIKMDEQGWYSVTPEQIAIKQAKRCQNATVVIDCFAGVGGNAIQFASLCYHVVAIEIDPLKVDMAINNARIYGVEDYIDFIVGDFFQLAPSLKGDIVFLSPPWGGPSYRRVEKFTLDLLKPKDGYAIFQAAQAITPNIIMFLPRNVDLHQVEELCWLSSPPLEFEIEENYVQRHLKGVTVYFGGAAASQCGCWFASIDTEFPGTIYASDKGNLHDPQYNYKMMKNNVNATNIIQLGLTLADLDRNIYTWEFNLSDFDIDHDPHQNKGSVEFLKRQGIDFRRNKEDGIPSPVFAEKFLSSGLVENRSGVELVWVGFQCSYDFGFFTKILTGQKLPDDIEDFRRDVKYYFGPRVYDVRYIMSFFPSLYGGLERVAETLGIARVAGKSHQAGSDSLLTYLTFIKLMDMCTNSGIEKSCRGVLYSLSRI